MIEKTPSGIVTRSGTIVWGWSWRAERPSRAPLQRVLPAKGSPVALLLPGVGAGLRLPHTAEPQEVVEGEDRVYHFINSVV